MKLSHNVLVIGSLSLDQERDYDTIKIRSKMESVIKFHCPVTGNHFKSIIVVADSQGYSTDNALRNVIQNFLNGNVSTRTRYFNREINCLPDHSKIHAVKIELQDPFKSLFEQLFDLSVWEIPKGELSY